MLSGEHCVLRSTGQAMCIHRLLLQPAHPLLLHHVHCVYSNSPKSLAKLRRQVRRTKEVLSANTFAPITVEELHDGKDFQSTIKREEFEDLAGDFWDRAAVRGTVLHVWLTWFALIRSCCAVAAHWRFRHRGTQL
jgi:hypothetical protein